MNTDEVIADFLERAGKDPRIGPIHIGVYITIINFWAKQDYKNPIRKYSHEVMSVAKILSRNTYHKCIADLHNAHFFGYKRSYNRNKPSEFSIPVLMK